MLYKNHGLLSEKCLSSTRHWLWGQMMFLRWAGARAESFLHGRFLSLLPSVHRCPNTAVLHLRGCLPGCLGQEPLSLLIGSTTWCSWNLVMTLMLPRCGCLRISQQSFLLLLEASSNTVPLGATRGLLPPSDSGAITMDYFLILLGLVCFIEWLLVWVRKLCFLLPIPCWGLVKNWSVCGAGISCYPSTCSVSGNTF